MRQSEIVRQTERDSVRQTDIQTKSNREKETDIQTDRDRD